MKNMPTFSIVTFKDFFFHYLTYRFPLSTGMGTQGNYLFCFKLTIFLMAFIEWLN